MSAPLGWRADTNANANANQLSPASSKQNTKTRTESSANSMALLCQSLISLGCVSEIGYNFRFAEKLIHFQLVKIETLLFYFLCLCLCLWGFFCWLSGETTASLAEKGAEESRTVTPQTNNEEQIRNNSRQRTSQPNNNENNLFKSATSATLVPFNTTNFRKWLLIIYPLTKQASNNAKLNFCYCAYITFGQSDDIKGRRMSYLLAHEASFVTTLPTSSFSHPHPHSHFLPLAPNQTLGGA